jgi:hypothetical protein
MTQKVISLNNHLPMWTIYQPNEIVSNDFIDLTFLERKVRGFQTSSWGLCSAEV